MLNPALILDDLKCVSARKHPHSRGSLSNAICCSWISDLLKRLNIRRSIQAFRQEYATEEDEDKDGNDFSSEDNAMASTSLDWAVASKVH